MTRRQNQVYQERLLLSADFSSAVLKNATATITCVSNANMADTDFVTISDGFRSVIYEYDKSANGVTAGRVSWAAGASTAADVAATLRTAILANQPAISVVDNLDGTLSLTHKLAHTLTNVAITENVANAGFLVSGFTGGQGLGSGISATTTVKRWKTLGRAFAFDRGVLEVPAGFVQDASNFWTIAVKNGSTTVASWSTQTTTGQGTITADTPVDLVNAAAASLAFAAADTLTLVATKTGTPADFPTASLVIEGRYL